MLTSNSVTSTVHLPAGSLIASGRLSLQHAAVGGAMQVVANSAERIEDADAQRGRAAEEIALVVQQDGCDINAQRRSGLRVIAAEQRRGDLDAADGLRGASENAHLAGAEAECSLQAIALAGQFLHGAAVNSVVDRPVVGIETERRRRRFHAHLGIALAGSCVALTANRYSMSPAACRVATMPGSSEVNGGLMPRFLQMRAQGVGERSRAPFRLLAQRGQAAPTRCTFSPPSAPGSSPLAGSAASP